MPEPYFITFNGETRSLSEWSRATGIPLPTLSERLKKGYPPERLLSINHGGRPFFSIKYRAEYKVWQQMHARCTNRRYHYYARYGGRGIKVCKRWNSFANFLADMKRRPSKEHSIERRNNDGNYCPENCYWATRAEQGRNKSNCRLITFQGTTRTLTDWARAIGMATSVLSNRINTHGWEIERALTTPSDRDHTAIRRHAHLYKEATVTIERYQSGESANSIAKSLSVTPYVVLRILRTNGIQIRTARETR
jgi:hypothetical protein